MKLRLRNISLGNQFILVATSVAVFLVLILAFVVNPQMQNSSDEKHLNQNTQNHLNFINQISDSKDGQDNRPTELYNTSKHFIIDVENMIVYTTLENKNDLAQNILGEILIGYENSSNKNGEMIFKQKDTDFAYYVMKTEGIKYNGQTCDVISYMLIKRTNVFTEFGTDVISIMFAVFLSLLLALFFWIYSLIKPLEKISEHVYLIGDGNLESTLSLNRKDEIGELADAIDNMQLQLLEQETTKQQMYQNISHDLKTPIAIIKSYAEGVKDGIFPYGDLEGSINAILENSNRLEKKVRSILLLSKLDNSKDLMEVSTNTTKINNVINTVVEQSKLLSPSINFEVINQFDLSLKGEEEQWRTAIENIVENATRYAKSIIRINVHASGIYIENDGDKIDSELIKSIFQPYETGKQGEFGLGLPISKKIIEQYGYKIKVENLSETVRFTINID